MLQVSTLPSVNDDMIFSTFNLSFDVLSPISFLLFIWMICFSYQYLYVSACSRPFQNQWARQKSTGTSQGNKMFLYLVCYGLINHIACILTCIILFDSFGFVVFFYLVLFSCSESPGEAANAKKQKLVFIVGALRIWVTCNSIELSFVLRRAEPHILVLNKKLTFHKYTVWADKNCKL